MDTIENPKKRDRTKKIILEQALGLFEKKGYEAVTMRDLAKSCDSSLGAFYYHFASKEAIVLELFTASMDGHIERTLKYLEVHKPSLENAMLWICRDRFKEFTPYQTVLRVLVQRLDPQDPVSPWHSSSLPIREKSVLLFEKLVSLSLSNLDAKSRRQVARALWLQHLLILGAWSFDRSTNFKQTEIYLKNSARIWKNLSVWLRVPGIKSLLNLVLAPLERLEKDLT